jgi:hypothetical protein
VLAAFFDHHLRDTPQVPWQLLERHPELRAAP